MPGYVYIDLDGTLTDPFEGISNCIAYAMERLGEARPGDVDMRRFIGPPLLDTFRELLGAERAPRALDYYRERFSDTGWLENAVYPGIPEALGKMKSDGFELHIATAKPHAYARKITSHFDLSKFFANEFGPELDGTRNNKGQLLAYALDLTGIDAANSVMVGDRIHDIDAARYVGMASIGVTWGYGTTAETEQAEYLCHNPSDLPATVAKALGHTAD